MSLDLIRNMGRSERQSNVPPPRVVTESAAAVAAATFRMMKDNAMKCLQESVPQSQPTKRPAGENPKTSAPEDGNKEGMVSQLAGRLGSYFEESKNANISDSEAGKLIGKLDETLDILTGDTGRALGGSNPAELVSQLTTLKRSYQTMNLNKKLSDDVKREKLQTINDLIRQSGN
jgi:hypothetical protein